MSTEARDEYEQYVRECEEAFETPIPFDEWLDPEPFRPTHVITRDGASTPVMLDPGPEPGPAYTEAEWESEGLADYERQEGGSWTFQGEPFAGRVRRLPSHPTMDGQAAGG